MALIQIGTRQYCVLRGLPSALNVKVKKCQNMHAPRLERQTAITLGKLMQIERSGEKTCLVSLSWKMGAVSRDLIPVKWSPEMPERSAFPAGQRCEYGSPNGEQETKGRTANMYTSYRISSNASVGLEKYA